ncbi:hypothetical protein Agub_g15364 [Astrephomene gubernaculifera]|uniref:Flagellar associated protein n=1 Tax=Astrephomene gubernaculifera TaxID=47775 RepID=A0AAD3E5E8_9CHLO|nr:hypothetical protein Agub_g15364 [Astrephomene gubernaculifera]
MDGPPGGEAGPSGFRNLEPTTREQRMAARDKDALEKTRLQARRRGPLKPPENEVGNPVVPPRNAPAYCDEFDRFNRDVAGEAHQRKQIKLQRNEEVYTAKRTAHLSRERGVWAADQALQQREADRYDSARAGGTGALRNRGGQSYDIITLDPLAGGRGQALAAKESAQYDKRQERAAVLYSRAHSVTHNIITGEPIRLPVPVKQQPQ